MEWSKLKNIVLLLLVCVNVALLSFLLGGELQNRGIQNKARLEAIAFLEKKGVTAAEGAIPAEMDLRPKVVERDLEWEGTIARALLGEDLRVQDRGAGVYRYSSGVGAIQFHNDGAFSGEFLPGSFPVGGSRAEDCLALLKTLDFEGTLLEEKGDSLTFRQTWEGCPLFSQQVTLEIEGGRVTAMTAGRRLVGQPAEDADRETMTVSTALIRFFNGMNELGGVCSRIDGVEQGYVSSTSLSGPMQLTPVWRIATDTDEYQMDLVTGALSRVT